METLIALVVVIIGAGAAASLAYGSSRTAASVRKAVREKQAAITAERVMRETIESVNIPYWERGEEGFLEARRRLEALSGIPEGTELQEVKDRFDRVRGVSWRYREGNREYRGAALFSSVPVMGAVFP